MRHFRRGHALERAAGGREDGPGGRVHEQVPVGAGGAGVALQNGRPERSTRLAKSTERLCACLLGLDGFRTVSYLGAAVARRAAEALTRKVGRLLVRFIAVARLERAVLHFRFFSVRSDVLSTLQIDLGTVRLGDVLANYLKNVSFRGCLLRRRNAFLTIRSSSDKSSLNACRCSLLPLF